MEGRSQPRRGRTVRCPRRMPCMPSPGRVLGHEGARVRDCRAGSARAGRRVQDAAGGLPWRRSGCGRSNGVDRSRCACQISRGLGAPGSGAAPLPCRQQHAPLQDDPATSCLAEATGANMINSCLASHRTSSEGHDDIAAKRMLALPIRQGTAQPRVAEARGGLVASLAHP